MGRESVVSIGTSYGLDRIVVVVVVVVDVVVVIVVVVVVVVVDGSGERSRYRDLLRAVRSGV